MCACLCLHVRECACACVCWNGGRELKRVVYMWACKCLYVCVLEWGQRAERGTFHLHRQSHLNPTVPPASAPYLTTRSQLFSIIATLTLTSLQTFLFFLKVLAGSLQNGCCQVLCTPDTAFSYLHHSMRCLASSPACESVMAISLHGDVGIDCATLLSLSIVSAHTGKSHI